MDAGPQRGRGSHVGVLADQAAQATLQRAARGRQVLPVSGGHPLRRMAQSNGHAGSQTEGHPLLRALRTHVYTIRDTLDELLRTFPIRTCSDAKLRRHERLGKPCLLFHIEKCSGPCVDEIDSEDYAGLVRELMAFLDGDTQPVLDRLDAEMQSAAAAMEFEQAARLRDRIATVRRAVERQQMVADRNEDFDVVGIAEDELEASVQVFLVRHGRVVGRTGFLLDKVLDLTSSETVNAAMEHLYGDEPAMGWPKLVLVPEMPDDPELYRAWLAEMRCTNVELRIPKTRAEA